MSGSTSDAAANTGAGNNTSTYPISALVSGYSGYSSASYNSGPWGSSSAVTSAAVVHHMPSPPQTTTSTAAGHHPSPQRRDETPSMTSLLLRTELLGHSPSQAVAASVASTMNDLPPDVIAASAGVPVTRATSVSASNTTPGTASNSNANSSASQLPSSSSTRSSSPSLPRGASPGPSSSPLLGPNTRRVLSFSPLRPARSTNPNINNNSLSPPRLMAPGGLGHAAHALLSAPRAAPRKISKHPYKILDAPSLQDDFYLNLLDWSPSNVLAVGLGSAVYLWSAATAKVSRLCDLSAASPLQGSGELITSLSWAKRSNHIAVGTSTGAVHLWDVTKSTLVRSWEGHTSRVGTMAWSSSCLATGSRDRSILFRDPRASGQSFSSLAGHRQEVCGLRWSPDESALASGGNDNNLCVWSAGAGNTGPMFRFSDHTAAVKAIAWSPHESGLLASGGGTADRCIRFWTTTTGRALHTVDTGSQVCNLAWSANVNEIVSTHGYSQNQIVVWKAASMTPITTLTGHTTRVLYLATSPDGRSIVTGAGDETLRFWSVFPGAKKGRSLAPSSIYANRTSIR